MGHFCMTGRRDAVGHRAVRPSTGDDDDAGVDAKARVRSVVVVCVRWGRERTSRGGGRAIATTRDETRIDLIDLI